MAPGALTRLLRLAPTPRLARPFAAKACASHRTQEPELPSEDETEFAGGEVAAPTEGIGKPLAEVLKELGKRANKYPNDDEKFTWSMYVENFVHNVPAREWSGEVRSIVYSSDGKSVSVVYRVTLHGIDAEIYREATGTASVDDTSYGDPVQKAEAMAFRRACARLGLGLHLYHEDMS
ncbi:unnamed protein product [Miscanthus lutarioriparius]|uniref:SnRK1-interacting protein 1 n=1 Tax=Miscanthus lutarioriparius TaxID=422564 RepID=A0A811P2Y4_9POAL|nr:unnamed protein product [Miscanthus lutarioriparius]